MRWEAGRLQCKGKMMTRVLALALLLCIGVAHAAELQSSTHSTGRGASFFATGASRNTLRKLMTSVLVDVAPFVRVDVNTGGDVITRRGGNSGPDSWQWWGGGGGGQIWQQPGHGGGHQPGWNRPPPNPWNRGWN